MPVAERNKPQVAVLMPVHASADAGHLEEALVSMRAQTHPGLRIFVHADGPLPRAHEEALARHLHTADDEDRIVRSARQVGLPAGLNRLIDLAMQEPQIAYLARMDADDISLPERIAHQVAFFEQRPEVAIAGTWCIEFAQSTVPQFYKQLPSDPSEVRRFMIYRSPLAHPTVMFRRRVFETGQRYAPDLKIMQDYELWARLLRAGYVISNVPEYLLWFRMAGDFYARRAGLHRAWGEMWLRARYARASGLLRPRHFFGLLGLFLIRLSPEAVKRLAYKHLRSNPR